MALAASPCHLQHHCHVLGSSLVLSSRKAGFRALGLPPDPLAIILDPCPPNPPELSPAGAPPQVVQELGVLKELWWHLSTCHLAIPAWDPAHAQRHKLQIPHSQSQGEEAGLGFRRIPQQHGQSSTTVDVMGLSHRAGQGGDTPGD